MRSVVQILLFFASLPSVRAIYVGDLNQPPVGIFKDATPRNEPPMNATSALKGAVPIPEDVLNKTNPRQAAANAIAKWKTAGAVTRSAPKAPTHLELQRESFAEKIALLWQKALYRLSQVLVASMFAKIVGLFWFSSCLILLGACVLRFAGTRSTWYDATFFAYSLLNNAPGASAVDEARKRDLLLANAIFVVGILSFAVILGVITSSIQVAVESVLAGDMRVLEKDHTVILNWNEKIVPLLRHLAASVPDGYKRLPIVVLADQDKEEMNRIISRGLEGHNIQVIVREGKTSLRDFHKISLGWARNVLILSPAPREDLDDEALHDLLTAQVACVRALQRRRRPDLAVGAWKGQIHFVVAAPVPLPLAELLGVSACQRNAFVQRALALSARQRGLTRLYSEVLTAGVGCQIYVCRQHKWPWLQGRRLRDIQLCFPSAVVMGWMSHGQHPEVHLKPSCDEILPAEALLVVLSHSKEDITCIDKPPAPSLPSDFDLQPLSREEHRESGGSLGWVLSRTPSQQLGPPERKQRVLILNLDDESLLLERIDRLSEPNTVVGVHLAKAEAEVDFPSEPENVEFEAKSGNVMRYADLQGMGVGSADTIIVLGCRDRDKSPDERDAQAIAVTSMIVEIRRQLDLATEFDKRGRMLSLRPPELHLIVAMEAPENVPELRVAAAGRDIYLEEFLVDYLESGALVQILRQPNLNTVFEKILDHSGSELVLISAKHLHCEDEELRFSEIMARAQARGVMALGVWERGNEPRLSPRLEQRFNLGPGSLIPILTGSKQGLSVGSASGGSRSRSQSRIVIPSSGVLKVTVPG